MKKIRIVSTFTLCAILVLLSRPAFSQDYKRSVVTDPSISRRCEALMEERNQKIQHKQRLKTMIVRNEKIQKITPPERQSILKKLKRNKISLENELKLTLSKIKNHEENIVRKGCPGITL